MPELNSKGKAPENMSFDPEVVKREIERIERIALTSKLSETERAELAMLKVAADMHNEKENRKKGEDRNGTGST